MSGGHLSKEFFELVKSIGESRSKQEEDKIIITEMATLKHHLNQPNLQPKKIKEYMIRAVYVEMLGHDASFAYVHAVKLAHEKHLLAKRIGYLTCNLFLHKDHELMLLLINTMQKDLQSPNHIEVTASLTSLCRLVNMEMIPAIAPIVFKLLAHPQEVVRKKAVVVVNRIFKIVPDVVNDQRELIRKTLCDPDPSVMGASLHILHEMSRANVTSCKDLVPSFVNILKQITEHKLPREFDYHRMPAPWMQVKLMSLLGLLGNADQKASEQMHDILQECIRRADSGSNAGYAVIYECVKTITRIYPDHSLMELAASNISRFISSDNHNLKYLGVTGLALIVQVDPKYAAEHQMVVVDCLEDPDETLKRKTLDLLFRMTNPQNVIVVADKLVFHLRTSVDVHLRRDLVQKITTLSERFAPNNEWYVNTMNTVFELGGDLVPAETAYNLMRLVAEGTGEDEESDMQFRSFAANTYLKLLEKPILTDVLVQVIAWVLGEYAKLCNVDGYSLEDIVDLLCECAERQFEDPATRAYLVTSITKLVGQNHLRSSAANTVMRQHRASRLTDLQQRCYEYEQLCAKPDLMRRVLPYDASCEDIEVDPKLAFLGGFVRQQLDMGQKPYQEPHMRAKSSDAGGDLEVKGGLNFTAYAAPGKPTPPPVSQEDNMDASPSIGLGLGGSEPTLNVGGKKMWGPGGYNGPVSESKKEPERPPPPPMPSSTSNSSSTPSTTKSTTKAPEKSAEMSEKEKLAAQLFGGMGGTPAVKPEPSKGPWGAKSTPTPAPAPAPAPAPPPSAQPASAPSPPAAGGGGDLLGFDMDPPSAPAAQAAPAAPSGGGGDLLGFDLMGGDAPAAAPAQAAPGPLLAPLSVTTQQVGQMWGQLSAQKAVAVQTSINNLQEVMARMASLNFAQVQIIGSEGIAAGRILPGNDPCFFHGKLSPGRLDVLIKCKDMAFTEKMLVVVQQALR